MLIRTGYLYHIKDEFFDLVNDENLMTNHERGKKRPTYFTIKDKDILWFIPISSKVEKYQKIIDKKVKKYGRCDTIIIREILGRKAAILFQNAFPTLEKYIDHEHLTNNGKPAKVIPRLKEEILNNFKYLIKLKNNGVNLFFTDIDRIKKQMIQELYNCFDNYAYFKIKEAEDNLKNGGKLYSEEEVNRIIDEITVK